MCSKSVKSLKAVKKSHATEASKAKVLNMLNHTTLNQTVGTYLRGNSNSRPAILEYSNDLNKLFSFKNLNLRNQNLPKACFFVFVFFTNFYNTHISLH